MSDDDDVKVDVKVDVEVEVEVVVAVDGVGGDAGALATLAPAVKRTRAYAVAGNATDDDKAQNRRVELVIVQDPSTVTPDVPDQPERQDVPDEE